MEFPAKLNRKQWRTYECVALVACALMSSYTRAADGDVKFSPSLGVAYVRSDNFYFQSNQANKITSNGLILSPSLSVSAKTSRLSAGASVSTAYAQFDTRGDDDNYFDPTVSGNLEYRAGSSHSISISASGQLGHDAFGQDRTQGLAVVSGELDQWITGGGRVGYRLGAPEALFNFEISGSGNRKVYFTNTAATETLNYGTYGGTLAAFINVSPKTAIVAEGGYSQVRFDQLFNANDRREGDDYFGRVGARWRAAAKTTGDVRVGWAERREAKTGNRTYQTFSWVASVTWQPEQRTTLSALTGLNSQESFLAAASVILNRSTSITWSQNWARRWSSNLNGSYIQSEFLGTARKDDITSTGLSLSYQAEKYLSIGLGANYTHRYSNAALSNYNGVSVFSNINLGL